MSKELYMAIGIIFIGLIAVLIGGYTYQDGFARGLIAGERFFQCEVPSEQNPITLTQGQDYWGYVQNGKPTLICHDLNNGKVTWFGAPKAGKIVGIKTNL